MRERSIDARCLLGALLLLLGMATPVLAADWYSIEVLVFAERDGMGLQEEAWSRDPGWPDVTAAVDLHGGTGSAQVQALSPSEMTLAAAASQLDRSGRYRTLLVTGWRQPGYAANQALPVRVRNLGASVQIPSPDSTPGAFHQRPSEPAVDGVVRMHRSRYLHVMIDLLYLRPDAAPAVGEALPLAATTSMDLQDALATPTVFRLSSMRRIRSGELHYFDHPMFGVLLRATPIGVHNQPEPDADPAASGSDESDGSVIAPTN